MLIWTDSACRFFCRSRSDAVAGRPEHFLAAFGPRGVQLLARKFRTYVLLICQVVTAALRVKAQWEAVGDTAGVVAARRLTSDNSPDLHRWWFRARGPGNLDGDGCSTGIRQRVDAVPALADSVAGLFADLDLARDHRTADSLPNSGSLAPPSGASWRIRCCSRISRGRAIFSNVGLVQCIKEIVEFGGEGFDWKYPHLVSPDAYLVSNQDNDSVKPQCWLGQRIPRASIPHPSGPTFTNWPWIGSPRGCCRLLRHPGDPCVLGAGDLAMWVGAWNPTEDY